MSEKERSPRISPAEISKQLQTSISRVATLPKSDHKITEALMERKQTSSRPK